MAAEVEGKSGLIDRVVIRYLRRNEIEKAETLGRLAFGTFLRIPDPLQNPESKKMISHRFYEDPKNILAAELDGELVGTNILTEWGSFAFFGPLAVRPDLWDSGVGSELVESALEVFAEHGISHMGLFTFADSPKHLGLYHKFGFCARFLTPLMEKEIEDASHQETVGKKFEVFSDYDGAKKEEALRSMIELTNELYHGLDLSDEIRMVDSQKLGDTLLLFENFSLSAFAVCQSGPNTEAGRGRLYIKFGAAKTAHEADRKFDELLSACEAFAVQKGLNVVEAGMNLSHERAYDIMLKNGFRTSFVGVAMQKPNEPAFLRKETFVIEDWR